MTGSANEIIIYKAADDAKELLGVAVDEAKVLLRKAAEDVDVLLCLAVKTADENETDANAKELLHKAAVDAEVLLTNATEDAKELLGKAAEDAKALLGLATETALELLARVKQLEGIIPICMYCHKIRDDAASWQQLEKYITEHSDAKFSHGVCPECFKNIKTELL